MPSPNDSASFPQVTPPRPPDDEVDSAILELEVLTPDGRCVRERCVAID